GFSERRHVERQPERRAALRHDADPAGFGLGGAGLALLQIGRRDGEARGAAARPRPSVPWHLLHHAWYNAAGPESAGAWTARARRTATDGAVTPAAPAAAARRRSDPLRARSRPPTRSPIRGQIGRASCRGRVAR